MEPFTLTTEVGIKPLPVIVIVLEVMFSFIELGLIELITGVGFSTELGVYASVAEAVAGITSKLNANKDNIFKPKTIELLFVLFI